MSTAFSKKMQGVATRLLSKYGSTVTLVRAGGKVWDPVAGEYVVQPSTSVDLTAIPLPISKNLATGIGSLEDGTTIQAGDMQVICDKGFKPSMEDKIFFDGIQWSIVAITPSTINDDAVAYFILVRK